MELLPQQIRPKVGNYDIDQLSFPSQRMHSVKDTYYTREQRGVNAQQSNPIDKKKNEEKHLG